MVRSRKNPSVNHFTTMPKFVVEFGSTGQPPEPDGRLHGPAFQRNHAAIWSALAPFLLRQKGDVLEIGSGTGQHIAEFARLAPDLKWWPSDILPSHLASIEAWRRHAGLTNLHAPQRIDLTDPAWSWSADGQPGGALVGMLCINVLHIAPWRVAQNLVAGAGRLLRADGRLFIYGPFMRDGQHSAPSNADFDASLRAQNAEWGVRDVRDLNALAQANGLSPAEIVPMPSNNLVLAFARAVRQN
jgi:SAM-dependent methyltransferase